MKRIGISQRVIIDQFGRKDALEQAYLTYYSQFNILLFPIPNVLTDLELYLDELHLDGFILSGGNDINPRMYNETSKKEEYADERDATERKIVDYALKNKLPLLGQCRGMQFLNVYFGGKLLENLSPFSKISHVKNNHEIEIVDEKFKTLFGVDTTNVNSFHNQGLSEKELAKELKIFALSADGIVEGFYHPTFLIFGIMWHPEREWCDAEINKKIINYFFRISL